MPVDPADAGNQGILAAGLPAGGLEPVGVAAAVVLEPEGVLRAEPRVPLLE
jgi:hypothetical protein